MAVRAWQHARAGGDVEPALGRQERQAALVQRDAHLKRDRAGSLDVDDEPAATRRFDAIPRLDGRLPRGMLRNERAGRRRLRRPLLRLV
eukprot:2104860-Prymnesium_polylepis.1